MPRRRLCLPTLASCCAVAAVGGAAAEEIAGDRATASISKKHTAPTAPACTASESSASSSVDEKVSYDAVNLPGSSHSFDPAPCSVVSLSIFNPFPNASCSSSSVVALAASPSSLHLYAAAEAGMIEYDVAALARIDSFSGVPGTGAVKSVAVTADGRSILTAHQDGRIRLWSAERGGRNRLLASLPTLPDRLRRLPIPCNHVRTGRRGNRRLWIEHWDAVTAVAAPSSADLFYSVSWDKSLKVWRSGDLRCAESVAAHDDAVNALAVAPDGTVYTASADRRIRVWTPGDSRRRRHELAATLERHRAAVNALAVSGDGALLYSGGSDRWIIAWAREGRSRHAAECLRGHSAAVLALACAGEVLVSGSSDLTVRIWRLTGAAAHSCVAVVAGHARAVRSVVVFRVPQEDPRLEEYRVCSASLDGEIRVSQIRVPI